MTTPTKLSVVFAGEIFDGSSPERPFILDLDGKAFVVRVRAMPSRHLGRVLALAENEAELLEFVCQVAVPLPVEAGAPVLIDWQPLTPEFVDSLAHPSHALLYESAGRLNFSRATAQAERKIVAGTIHVQLMERSENMVKPLAEKLAASVLSSLARSASPDAPSTKS